MMPSHSQHSDRSGLQETLYIFFLSPNPMRPHFTVIPFSQICNKDLWLWTCHWQDSFGMAVVHLETEQRTFTGRNELSWPYIKHCHLIPIYMLVCSLHSFQLISGNIAVHNFRFNLIVSAAQSHLKPFELWPLCIVNDFSYKDNIRSAGHYRKINSDRCWQWTIRLNLISIVQFRHPTSYNLATTCQLTQIHLQLHYQPRIQACSRL